MGRIASPDNPTALREAPSASPTSTMRNQPPPVPLSMPKLKFVHRYRPAMVNRRPRLELHGSSATPEEAAAVMAAVEQFLRDTAPPPADEPQPSPGCRRHGARPSTAALTGPNTWNRIWIWYFGRMRQGSLENPEVREDVPGHVIPILQREFDDFDNEAEKFLAGETAGERVHRLPPEAGRLRPAPGRRADDPREAAVRRHHAGADGHVRRRGRAVRAAQQGPHHHAPEHPDPPRPAARRGGADPRDLRRRALQPRGLRQHRPQRDRRPVGRRLPRRAVRPDALRRAPTCATSCATPRRS